jgi:hypothetical protein
MYITRTDGPSPIRPTNSSTERKGSQGSSFVDEIQSLLTDAVELTNPNGERNDQSLREKRKQLSDEIEIDAAGKLPAEDAPAVSARTSINIKV